MVTFIVFIIMFGSLVAVHELGHLIAAKWAGVYCYEYSIGMGPLIYKHQGKETQFSLRLLPIGGYVSMAGEQEASDEAYPDVVVPEGRRLYEQSHGKQIIIMLAGVTMNFIMAFVLMYTAVMLNGGYNDLTVRPTIVTSVVEDSAASQAGLEVNDEIIGVIDSNGNEVTVDDYDDLSPYIDGSAITLIVDRDGSVLNIEITPQYSDSEQRYMMGITTPSGTWIQANVITSVKGSVTMLVNLTGQIFDALVGMFTGDGLSNVSGVVGVYQATDQVVDMGIVYVFMFIAMFSLNLGIFNLLPIPALDGGRALILLIELIVGHPLNKKIENGIIVASFALLMLLTVVITLKDIINLF